MEFSQNHSLNKEEAKQRVAKLAECWKNEYGICVDWNGDKAHLQGDVKGFSVDAHVTVNDKSIDAEGKDPGFLMRKVATAYLKSKLSDCLDPKKNIDEITA